MAPNDERVKDDDLEPGKTPAFRSRRSDVSNPADILDTLDHKRKILVDALDGMYSLEERVDLVMTDILETGGSWQAGGSGDVPPRTCFIELQIHDITARGMDIGQAIANWVAAARRIIEGRGEDL
ncbi:hypothetical protein [Phaeobacter sp.]|uniref:hypothetical protein n=1 Tax=Phaeobacter sp. TaxID=1902409 RepID=UPI0025EF2F5E|nr:hypothetical protein [Phaeobacter sp.]